MVPKGKLIMKRQKEVDVVGYIIQSNEIEIPNTKKSSGQVLVLYAKN